MLKIPPIANTRHVKVHRRNNVKNLLIHRAYFLFFTWKLLVNNKGTFRQSHCDIFVNEKNEEVTVSWSSDYKRKTSFFKHVIYRYLFKRKLLFFKDFFYKNTLWKRDFWKYGLVWKYFKSRIKSLEVTNLRSLVFYKIMGLNLWNSVD